MDRARFGIMGQISKRSMKVVTITDTQAPEIRQLLKQTNDTDEQIELRDENGSLLGVLYPSQKALGLQEFESRLDEFIEKRGGIEGFRAWVASFQPKAEKDPSEMSVDELVSFRRHQLKAQAKDRLQNMPGDEFTVSEVASLLGKSQSTIAQAVSRGKLTAVTRDGKRLISRADLEHYISGK